MSNDITGTLAIPPTVTTFTAMCTALVRDITNSDSPDPQPVAVNRWELTYLPGTPPPFTVTGIPEAALNAAATGTMALNLEVHIDRDGSGALSSNDLASLAPYPVTRATTESPVSVQLNQL